MMVPPLSKRPVTDEDEEQFRAESTPRKYTLRQRWANHRAQARRNRPAGAKARVRAWMDADIVDWGIRASVVLLIIAGLYATYTNGITNGWWPAWGDKPTTAATPTTRPAPTAPATAPPRRQCREATKSAPMASSYAPPNTQHPPTPNPNYQKKPNKTQKEEQKQLRSTT